METKTFAGMMCDLPVYIHDAPGTEEWPEEVRAEKRKTAVRAWDRMSQEYIDTQRELGEMEGKLAVAQIQAKRPWWDRLFN